jgi:two-component sensor histidine kinase
MIKYLKVPGTEHGDFNDKARYGLTWRLSIMFSTVIGVLTAITFLANDRFYPYYLGVLTLVVLGMFYMYKTKTYKLVSYIISIGATLILIFSVVFINDALHTVESLWMLVIVLFAYFTLGKTWGVVFLTVNVLLYFFYFNFLFENTKELRLNLTSLDVFIISVEFAFSMFLIAFIMFQFSLVNSYAEKHKKKAFEALQNEKRVVEEQNREKTVLLQEIHHRVKNNLQVIVSLLRIQSSKLKSKESIRSFNDAITRIMTMSLIHKKMYEKESLINIDIVDYLNTLIDDLIKANTTNGSVEYSVDASLKKIGSKTIVPLALIINELVSNSLKHAFKEGGKINLILEVIDNDYFKMTYSDNGIWKKKSDESSFGLQLIEVFSDQLEGSFEREIDKKGTHYIFQLKSVDQ